MGATRRTGACCSRAYARTAGLLQAPATPVKGPPKSDTYMRAFGLKVTVAFMSHRLHLLLILAAGATALTRAPSIPRRKSVPSLRLSRCRPSTPEAPVLVYATSPARTVEPRKETLSLASCPPYTPSPVCRRPCSAPLVVGQGAT